MALEKIVGIKFEYDGSIREVDNITVEPNTVIGFEMRKNGQYSNKVKRYSRDKMRGIEFMVAAERKGVISRP